jgi:transposase
MRSVNELTSKKRDAVRLRLSGLSLAQVKAQTGLSVPTIIKAVEQFKASGWQGLTPEGRGRKPSLLANSSNQKAAILRVMQRCFQSQPRFVSIDDLLTVYAELYKAVSKKTMLRRLSQLVPERDHSEVFASMGQFIDHASQSFMAQSLAPETVALLARSRRLVLGFHPVLGGCIFYTLDGRGERRFAFYVNESAAGLDNSGDESGRHHDATAPNGFEGKRSALASGLSEQTLVAQLRVLVQEASAEKPLFVVIKTDSLARYQHLAAWQKANEGRCFLLAQWALSKCIEKPH